jgi:hypothetical protein
MPIVRKQFNMFADIENDEKCTIISIVPFPVNEFKPGIYPGRFVMEPCLNYKQPKTLEVGTSVYFIPQYNGDEEMPAHVVKIPCKDIAKSVVDDYLQGQMDIDEYHTPGITFLPGKITSEEFVKHHIAMHISMQQRQLGWFERLVQRADNDWNRYKRHSVVSENQRFACRALGMERDWMTKSASEVPIKCPACLSNCSPEAIVCSTCRCILNKEKYEKLNFAA